MKKSLEVVPFYQYSIFDGYASKATSFDVCYVAYDGYRVVKVCKTKQQAEDFIETNNGVWEVE